MKTKFLLLSVLVLVMSIQVEAKKNDKNPFKIGIGGTIGIPTGDVSTEASLGLGFDLKGEYTVMPQFGITLSLGYANWILKSDAEGAELGLVPILVGAKYNFTDQIYGSAEFGVSIGTAEGAENGFTFAPGIGYKISEKFDLMLKYQSASFSGDYNMAFFGVRAGYTF